MQHDEESKIAYQIANGPEGLWEVLNSLLEKVRSENKEDPAEYYIKYVIGSQISLIKVDLNARPVQFWYYDLLGRPPTRAVKDTIAKFLWEKCGVKEQYEISQEGAP